MAEQEQFADLPRGEPPGDPAPGEAVMVALYTGLAEYLREHGEEPAYQFDFGPEVDEQIQRLFDDATPTLNQLFRAPAGHEQPYRPWAVHLMRRMTEEALGLLIDLQTIDLEKLEEAADEL